MCLDTESNWLDKFDLIGGKVSYKINGNSLFKIPFGGFMTILVAIFCSGLISVFLIPFVSRKIPRIAFETYKDLNPEPFDIYNTNFFIAYNLRFPQVPSRILNEMFNISCSFISIETKNVSNITKTTTHISTRNAEETDFKGNEYLYSTLNLAEASTINFQKDMSLQGSAVSTTFSYIEIQVNLWNLTKNYLSKVENFLNDYDGTLQIFYSDLAIRLTNYSDPFSTFVSFFDDALILSNSKIATIEFSVNNITLDNSYFFEQNINSTLKTLHLVSNIKSNYRDSDNKNIYTVNIQLSKVKTNYIRSYMNVPELVANIGGILSACLLFFTTINEYVNDYMLNIRLMENMYNFDKKYEETQLNSPTKKLKIRKVIPRIELSNIHKSSDKNHKTDDLIGNNNHSFSEVGIRKPKKEPQIIIKKKEFVRPDRGQVNKANFFTSEDAIFTLFLCCFRNGKLTKRKALYKKAKYHIDNYMDILKVTKKLIEVDLLKYLVLNPEQLGLCNIIGRPFITLDNSKLNKIKFSDIYLDYAQIGMKSNVELKTLKQEEKEALIYAYNTVHAKENKSIIDKKLLNSCVDNLDLIQ